MKFASTGRGVLAFNNPTMSLKEASSSDVTVLNPRLTWEFRSRRQLRNLLPKSWLQVLTWMFHTSRVLAIVTSRCTIETGEFYTCLPEGIGHRIRFNLDQLLHSPRCASLHPPTAYISWKPPQPLAVALLLGITGVFYSYPIVCDMGGYMPSGMKYKRDWINMSNKRMWLRLFSKFQKKESMREFTVGGRCRQVSFDAKVSLAF
jgi:hypothetical protein